VIKEAPHPIFLGLTSNEETINAWCKAIEETGLKVPPLF
jgi:hypothetical protein